MQAGELPQGALLPRGETAGRRCWERLVRESVGSVQIHLRFPVWEEAREANALVEAVMARLYAYACRLPQGEEQSVVCRYRLIPGEGELRLCLQGYAGPREGYCPEDWVTLCFPWQGECPCREVIFPQKRRKNAKGGGIC